MDTKKILYEYKDFYIKYTDKYGEKTVILMQVGGFYEYYGIENDFGNVNEIATLLLMHVSGKSYTDEGNNLKCKHQMAGFPLSAIDKYNQILVRNGYTIVIVDQEDVGKKTKKRAVKKIISPGTNIDYCENSDSNWTLSIFLDQITDDQIFIGLALCDITTGENKVFEIYSDYHDKMFGMDEVYRFIQMHCPIEIVIYINNIYDMTDIELITYLEIGNTMYHIHREINNIYLQPSYQNQFLQKIYKNKTMLSIVNYLELDRYQYALNAFIFLLNFIYEHDETIIQRLDKPIIWDDKKHLVLTNDSIHQLNLVADKNMNIKHKNDSLLNILNKTSTPMGKRYLRQQLLNPLIDPIEIQHRYDLIELMINNKRYVEYENHLKYIPDIERLHRKLCLKKIQPYEFVSLHMAYGRIIDLCNICNNDNIAFYKEYSYIPTVLNEYMDEYLSFFDISAMSKTYCNLNITHCYFKEGVFSSIDKINNKIEGYSSFFNNIVIEFSKLNQNAIVKKEHNEKDGKFFTTTKTRAKLIKDELQKMKDNHHDFILDIDKINFKEMTSSVKIESPEIKNRSDMLFIQSEKLKVIQNTYYIEKCNYLYDKYKQLFPKIAFIIQTIDVAKSNTRCSIEYKYSRPKIDNNQDINSYCECNDLRHPIIERISNSEYITNNMILGKNNQQGILLFGVNAVGKSSFMKSVGIAILMAQAGMYVSCSSMIYKPYHYIFTRILNNDNIFKGLSSFAVEMSELRNILKRSNDNSLVLGDELCSGTESTSAISIVTAGVITLAKRNSSFIFATHLHDLSKMKEIDNLEKVKQYHLRVEFNKENKKLIYHRKLENGSGSAIYGLEVCKAMDLPNEFIDMANTIRKGLMNIDPEILESKKSQYNSNLYMDKCSICGAKAIDTHHIKPQEDADENNYIEGMHKNTLSNLVILCEKCHNNTHHGTLEIKGYTDTSEGKELDFSITSDNNNKSRKKFSIEQLELMKTVYHNYSNKKMALNILENNHNIKCSIGTYNKILNGTY